MISGAPRATFRDPAGSLSLEENLAVRTIGVAGRSATLEFLDSAFCRRAQARGDLIAAEVDDASSPMRLLHPRVPVPTYPWEWTVGQWLAAAELTLDLCGEALTDGWILKDATPLNILFTGTRPILVDILSFERRDPGSSIWLAYGQYVRTFLLPLLMNRLLNWPLAMSLFKRDGYEPADCYAALDWPQRLSRTAFWPITLPTMLEKRKVSSGKPGPAVSSALRTPDPELTDAVIKRTLRDLRRRTFSAIPPSKASSWSDYQGTLTHYTAEQSADKVAWVRSTLETIHPLRVLDVGANIGEFSALAASSGAEVIALERDQVSADLIFSMARQRGLNILAIHADVARPTPAVGWWNSESAALLPRLQGYFDLVLMLAVVHHLILMEQIPIPAILALCHSLTTRHLVLEWVPPSDPMYQSLMRGRDHLYGAFSELDLLEAACGLFRTLDRHPLTNGRVLFLFEKIGSPGTID